MSENLPTIGLRLILKRIVNGKKTPKYGVWKWGGDRAEMQLWHDNFTGRNGICGYLKNHISKKSNAPEMNFELKNGFNLSGLKMELLSVRHTESRTQDPQWETKSRWLTLSIRQELRIAYFSEALPTRHTQATHFPMNLK